MSLSGLGDAEYVENQHCQSALVLVIRGELEGRRGRDC
jgi:hypothetical protein